MGALPETALISPVMLERAPALPLLIWLYSCLEPGSRDVEFTLDEAGREILGGTPYGTMRRWWTKLNDAPCFAAVRVSGRGGLRVTFADEWIDARWRENEIINDRETARNEITSDRVSLDGQGNEITSDLISWSADRRNAIINDRESEKRDQIRSPSIRMRVSHDHDLSHEHDQSPERAETRGSTSRERAAGATPLAPISRLPQRNTPSGDPNQQSDAVRLLVSLLGGRIRPNAFQAKLITELVPNGDRDALERWRATLEVQLAAGKRRVDWMLARFQERDDRAAAARLRQRAPSAPPAALGGPSATPDETPRAVRAHGSSGLSYAHLSDRERAELDAEIAAATRPAPCYASAD